MTDDSDKGKVIELINKYKQKSKSFLELELKLIFFICPSKVYKCDSLLRPFPKRFLTKNNEKQFDKLNQFIKTIPNLRKIDKDYVLDLDCWHLLNWVFTFNSISLNLLDNNEKNKFLLKLNIKKVNFIPQCIFKVNYPSIRTRFVDSLKEYTTFQVYHGTKVENVFSILHNGLINNLNKRNIFDPGTYFSKNIDVAILFSPFYYVNSSFCDIQELSCIFLCDIINHPSIKEKKGYYIVQNDDLVNITHLLVYCRNHKKSSQNQLMYNPKKFYQLMTFIIIFFVFYIMYFYKTYS